MRRILASLPRWFAAALVVSLAVPAAASSKPAGGADAHDPVYVFYPRGSCQEDAIELEVWNRESSAWAAHPEHARVPVESCQLEDAGILLQEIRWRCIETTPAALAPAWVVGLDVFNPNVMERCAGNGRVKELRDAEIVITSPAPGSTVRERTPNVALEGSVRIGGLAGVRYDVVLALDVSRRVGRSDGVFDAEVGAARSFVSGLSHRLGDVRIGVVTFPNRQVSRNDPGGTGARRDVALGGSYAELDRGLRAVQARGHGSFQSFSSGLDFALAELLGKIPGSGAREDARKVLVIAADGRGDLPFGAAAADSRQFQARFGNAMTRAEQADVQVHFFALTGLSEEPPDFIDPIIGAGRGAFHRVLQPQLGTAFFEVVSLPYIRHVEVVDLGSGRAVRDLVLRRDGRFRANVPVSGGPNPLLVTGVTSEGVRVEHEVVIDFDESLIREELRAAERERMREVRERRKKVEIEAAEPRRGTVRE
jgi:hypothetical protein